MFEALPAAARVVIVIVGLMIITIAVKGGWGRIKVQNHRIQTGITLIYSLIQYVTFIVGLTWVLSILGVDVNMIFASVGIVALIVGFSAESLIADVITGLFMIFENQFNVGDVVEVDGYRGSVEKIGIRTISVRDAGDNLKIVNNSNIKNMVNLSSDISRAICDIGVSYEEDLVKVEEQLPGILEEIYGRHKDIFLHTPAYIGVQELKKQGLLLRFMADVEERDIFSGRRILNRELYLELGKRNIKISHE